jgi:ABC-type phosphate transport system substrate-binding protein
MSFLKQKIEFSLVALVLSVSVIAEAGEAVTVVSPERPETALSKNEVRDIFLGRRHRFPNGEKATPIDQPENSPVRNEFYSNVIGKSPAQIKSHWSKIVFTGRGNPPKDVLNDTEVKQAVKNDSGIIGYIDKQSTDERVRVLGLEQ